MQLGSKPWHLWGGETVWESFGFSALTTLQLTPAQQLVNIDYGRPETWNFFFGCQFYFPPGFVGVSDTICAFDLFFGVGRVNLKAEYFVRLGVDMANSVGGAAGSVVTRFARLGRVLRSNEVAVTPEYDAVENIPAQNIQCLVKDEFLATAPPAKVRFQAQCFFAPEVHVRPDWFVRKFNGELSGR